MSTKVQSNCVDTKRKAMECVIRKKKKAEAAEQRAQMLIEISKKKGGYKLEDLLRSF